MAKTTFVDGNILTKTGGVRVLAAWLNKVFNHRHSGLDEDGSAPLDYAVDTGIANGLVAVLTTALPALVVGLPVYIKVAVTNTEAATLNLNGLGALAIQKLGGQPLAAGDLQAGQIIIVAYDGAVWQLLSYNSPSVTDAATLQGQGAARLTPPGIKGEFFMPTVPDGWLACDGRAVLRVQYPDLFAAIGTTWGAGDNVSTFNLPEARGEFFRAWDNGRGVDAARAFASWQGGGNASHTHSGTTEAAGVHSHSLPVWSDNGSGAFLEDASGINIETPVNTGSAGSHQHEFVTAADGIAESRPRNLAVLVCIKY